MYAVYKCLQQAKRLEITTHVGDTKHPPFLDDRRDSRRLETLIDPARGGASVEHRKGATCFERR